MLRVLSRAQLRRFDQLASERLCVPSLVLMENAGRGAAEHIFTELRRLAHDGAARVVVVCGAGNNGGDGYVVARRLLLHGVPISVFALRPEAQLRGDALANHRAFTASGGRVLDVEDGQFSELERALADAAIVVDAIFGTGLDRAIGAFESAVIARINDARALRVALDLPSGLDADSGDAHGAIVRADLTVTFAAHKAGLFSGHGVMNAGRVELVDIGVPPAALADVGEVAHLLTPADIVIEPRAADTHKVTAGRVLVLSGSPGKVGASLLVSHGALRAGAGLATIAGVPELANQLDLRVLEAMTARLDPDALEASLEHLLSATDCVAIGPGLGFTPLASRIVERVVVGHTGPVVVDADAISHFKGRAEALKVARGPRVLTPHAGELARLLGTTSADVGADRLASVQRAVEASNAVVLLKGPHTIVAAPGNAPVFGRAGSPALATGGAGDVLTGIIAALCCQGDPFRAAFSGAFVHALAAEALSRETGGDRGLFAHEVADRVPTALAELSARLSRDSRGYLRRLTD